MFIVIVVLLALACMSWKQEAESRSRTDWAMKNDPDFRDWPGNKYFRG